MVHPVVSFDDSAGFFLWGGGVGGIFGALLIGCLFSLSSGWPGKESADWCIDWLVGSPVAFLAGWLDVWLVGYSVG